MPVNPTDEIIPSLIFGIMLLGLAVRFRRLPERRGTAAPGPGGRVA